VPAVIYGNVANQGLIDICPQIAAWKCPVGDRNGLQADPDRQPAAPPGRPDATNINVQALTVKPPCGKRETSTTPPCWTTHRRRTDLDQIWSLVDDLIEAHGDWLPAFH
jgi:alpha-galactosidase